MIDCARGGSRDRQRGQVLPLTALFMFVLLGISALVLDVARVYSLQQFERSVADAAALTGAQDLQTAGSKAFPSAAQQAQARTDALALLNRELGHNSGLPGCVPDLAGNYVDCSIPGTDYLVSIKTPSPSVMTVNSNRAVQVTVRQPRVSLTLARLVGQNNWDVGITSVAGLSFETKYSVVTLQPPHPRNNGTDQNLCQDLVVKGNGTVVNVIRGGVGTNTSVATTNAGVIKLAGGDNIDHYDDITNAACGLNSNPTWSTDVNGNPQGNKIGSLILDPSYPYAAFPTTGATPAPSFATQAAGAVSCTDSRVKFPTDLATIQFLTPQGRGQQTCYLPGIYEHSFTVSNRDVAYLAPGAYSFPAGLTVDGLLAGGLVDSQPGVVLVFVESGSSKSFVAQNANSQVVLNTGSRSCSDDGCRATATTDFAGKLVKTAADLVLTVEVLRDDHCFSGTTPSDTGCSGDLNNNKTVTINAAERVQIAGIIYGPSDNMTIVGGSEQDGLVGQVFSWSVTYTGGSQLNQSYPGGSGNGVLRLDTACTGPATVCNP